MKVVSMVAERLKIWNLAFIFLILSQACAPDEDRNAHLKNASHYLNLNDSVEYVGQKVCIECHYQIYQSYLRTGMGQSFDTASPQKSAALIGEDSLLFDPGNNLFIKPYWKNDSLMIKEYRLNQNEVTHQRTEYVNFVVGSGQHTNSHIYLSGKYAYQLPFTYYTQQGMFDLPPGFEDGNSYRFTRKVGLECMSCHNGFPDLVLGSENKYESIPDGIDCERCHGPGEIHVMLKKSGFIIDTSKYIDYSIVNPAKLPMALQTDLCARCHLQGTMVLQPEKSFYDFKPGMNLDEVMDIFMPLFEGGKEDFIMASHYERMVQSKCYISSGEQFTCTDCHNPHITRKETSHNKYNKLCVGCHYNETSLCSLAQAERDQEGNNCVSCHMREGHTRDIPHVFSHDHKISIPQTEEQLNSERVFKGLISVNNPQTEALHIARGYLLEYESYHADPNYLDSAWMYLEKTSLKNHEFYFNALINYYFLSKNYQSISKLIENKGIRFVLDSLLMDQEYSNYDAWTAYRIGQAYESLGNGLISKYFYKKAIELAPFMLEFQLKYGNILATSGEVNAAIDVFNFVIKEDPRSASAYVNLGYLYVKINQVEKGEASYLKALELDPDHIQALLNLAAVMAFNKKYAPADEFIKRVLELEPENLRAIMIKRQIQDNL